MAEKTEAVVAQNSPYMIEVQAGKTYFWCACGKSAKQPFCDGAHKGGSIKSLMYKATETKTLAFCGCKKTANSPLCDGSHSS